MKKRTIKPSAGEPIWNPELGEEQISSMLNWYSYHKSSDELRDYFVDYLMSKDFSEDFIKKIEKLPGWQVRSAGLLCRIVSLTEHQLPEKYLQKIKDYIEEAKVLIVSKKEEKKEVVVEEKPKKEVDIQERLEQQLCSYLGEIEGVIDDFLTSKDLKLKYDFEDLFKRLDVKHQQAKNIAENYQKGILKELEEALEGKDEQLVEAYSHLGKSGLKKFIAFINEIILAANNQHDVSKKISLMNRKPRERKPKPAGVQVSKLKYLREFETYKSVMPSKIPGSTQLWVYNTKYRTLGVYVCDNVHGFSVKGCTILNYDPAQSVFKKLRKPEEILPKVLDAGKVALKKILPEIRAKERRLTGRINGDTILLKVI